MHPPHLLCIHHPRTRRIYTVDRNAYSKNFVVFDFCFTSLCPRGTAMGRVNAVVGVGTMGRMMIRRMVDRGLLYFASFHPFMPCLSVCWTVLFSVSLSHYALSCPILSYIVLFCSVLVSGVRKMPFSQMSCLCLCFLFFVPLSTRLDSPVSFRHFPLSVQRPTHSPLTSHLKPITDTVLIHTLTCAHPHFTFDAHILPLPTCSLTYLLAKLV